MKKKTQKQKVEELLLKNGAISNFYCINNRITIRLGAIINLLTKEGYKFETFYGKEKGYKKENWKNYYYFLKKVPQKKLL